MMTRVSLPLLLLVLFQRALALDHVVATGKALMNNATNGLITLNGIWYLLSNSTTDVAKMDSLTNPEVCRRDAALMSKLGINTIYVDALDPTANHDDCFSIFNSVGIYVAVAFNTRLFIDGSAIENTYTTQRLHDMFEWVDAVKDYENLLAFDVGTFPNMEAIGFDWTHYAEAQKIFRAMIRDLKEYIKHNSPRPILVGGSLTKFASHPMTNASMASLVDYLSCAVPNETASSQSEFLGFVDFGLYDVADTADPAKTAEERFGSLPDEIGNSTSTIPVWYSAYGSAIQNNATIFPLTNETLMETDLLYNTSSNILISSANSRFSGGARYGWTNVRLDYWLQQLVPATVANWGLTVTDKDGNVQLTSVFDTLRSIFAQYNTESWLSGVNVQDFDSATPPECKPTLIANATIPVGGGDEITLATDWALPTRPPGLDALITSGVQGHRGQMVDVIVTTIKYQIRDTKGSVITDVVLSPSKSQARITTEATNLPTITSSPSLSVAAKAGIGVGASVGGLIFLSGAAYLTLFLIRRRGSKASPEKEESTTSEDGYQKAELATGPEVETQPFTELPGKTNMPKEAHGDDRFPTLSEMEGSSPVELPAYESAQELEEQNPMQESEGRSPVERRP